MSSDSLMLRLLSASVAAANRAGQIIREVLKGGQLSIVDKGGNDPQTEADRKAQRCIVGTLSTRFPGIKIIGEETLEPSDEDQKLLVAEDSEEVLNEKCPPQYTTLQEKDVVVWVDPLDGTTEFTQGIHDAVTVLIGISVSGKAVGGVIHQPFLGQEGHTIWAWDGLGVRGVDIADSSSIQSKGLRVVVTRSHSSQILEEAIAALNPIKVLRAGGCGNKILMVLRGEMDTYVYTSRGTKKWDTCAGEALVRAAGGVLTDVHGKDIDYGNTDPAKYQNMSGVVVCLSTKTQEEVLAKIPEHVKAAFPKL